MPPRTDDQNQQVREERRQSIMAGARKVFARRGLAATKITDIAAAAGMSHGLVYHYFASKEEVFTALVEEACQGALWAVTMPAQMPGSPWDKLSWMVNAMLMGVRQSPEHWMVMIQVYTSDSAPEESRRLLVEYAPKLNEPLYQLIREGQAAGQVVAGDPIRLAGTLMACVTGLAVNEMLGAMAAASFPDLEMVLRILKA